MFWNICRGFRNEDRQVDPRKVAIAADFVRSEDPDVLVLNEADYLADYHESAFDYRGTFAFDHVHGHQYAAHMGNCILSRHPLIDPRVHVAGGRSGLACGIGANGGVLNIATFHAHPHTSSAAKADAIVATAHLRPGPCIMAGDFNAISPDDGLTVAGLEFRLRPIAKDKSVSMATRLLGDGEVIFAALRRSGFHDLMLGSERRHTMPSRLPDGDRQTQVRIDVSIR